MSDTVAPVDEVIIELDDVTYDISTVALLDDNIRTTDNPVHRDALLDARNTLYPAGTAA